MTGEEFEAYIRADAHLAGPVAAAAGKLAPAQYGVVAEAALVAAFQASVAPPGLWFLGDEFRGFASTLTLGYAPSPHSGLGLSEPAGYRPVGPDRFELSDSLGYPASPSATQGCAGYPSTSLGVNRLRATGY